MYIWVVFIITLISHIALVVMFDRQRKQLESLRGTLHRQRRTIQDLESQVRLASRRLFK
jgi:heme exporter protein D